MSISFREKNLWVDLAATLGIAAYYALHLYGFGTEKLADIHAVMDLLWDVVVLCILVSIVSWIALSVHDKKAADASLDEREQLVELKATRYGYWALQAAISFVVIVYGLETLGMQGEILTPIGLPPFTALHIIVASYVIAELVVTASQLWGLRRDL